MKVGIQTWGTEGDVRPFVALAHALGARGHAVRLLYTSVEGRDFGPLAAGCGVDARSVGAPYFVANEERLEACARATFAEKNPLRQVRFLLEDLMDPVVEEMLLAAKELAAESDVVVGHFMLYAASSAAKKQETPFVAVAMQPVFPSREFAPIGMPELGRLLNPLLWLLFGSVLESVLAARVNAVRAHCGLPPLKGLLKHVLDEILLALVALSPSLFPRPPDWDARIQLSGFLGIPETAELWEPEPRLREFLEGGEPPAFLTFGSMFSLDERRTIESVRLLAEAVVLARTRGIIQAPARVIEGAPQHDCIQYVEHAPHAQLFPRCSLIVHHGGAGTMQAALLAGRPSVVVPHATDQFYFGELLHARGVGAKPLKRTALAAKPLAERIRSVMDEPAMAARAKAIGDALREEDGALRAATLIEEAMKQR